MPQIYNVTLLTRGRPFFSVLATGYTEDDLKAKATHAYLVAAPHHRLPTNLTISIEKIET